MTILSKQFYNTSIFFTPVENPLMINSGLKRPSFRGFFFQKSGQFGDIIPVDLTDFTVNYSLYINNTLMVQGVMDIIDVERGEVEYSCKDFETNQQGVFEARIELIYSKEPVAETKPKVTTSIDFVASSVEYTYDTGTFTFKVNDVQLIIASEIVIEVDDTKEQIATKISDAINADTATHNHTASVSENLIEVTLPSGLGDTLNDEDIEVLSDDHIVTTSNKILGGVTAIEGEEYTLNLPTKKDYYRVVIS